MRDREKVLDMRRSTLGKPCSRSIALRERRAILEYQSSVRQGIFTSHVVPPDGNDAGALVPADEGEDDEDDFGVWLQDA